MKRINLKETITLLTILAVVGYAAFGWWANTDDKVKELARRSIIVAGYSDVVIVGYQWWGCSSSDSIHLKFTAKGPTGIPTRGVACANVLSKDFSIRH